MLFYLLLILTGLLFIYWEFYLPGGIFAVLGALLLLSGLVLITTEASLAVALFAWVSTALAIAGVIALALWRIRTHGATTGLYAAEDQQGFTASEYDRSAVGKTGEAVSDLKPGGQILVDGQRHSAISESGYIVRGESVLVLQGDGDTLIVRRSK